MIGYMPDFFGVYDDMKVVEYLEFFASAYRIKGPARKKICEEVLELVDLTYKRDCGAVTSLSRGMTQRLGLAHACCTIPRCCSWTSRPSGLDPRARIEMHSPSSKNCGTMGKTILVSQAALPGLIADICNKISIIRARHACCVQRRGGGSR